MPSIRTALHKVVPTRILKSDKHKDKSKAKDNAKDSTTSSDPDPTPAAPTPADTTPAEKTPADQPSSDHTPADQAPADSAAAPEPSNDDEDPNILEELERPPSREENVYGADENLNLSADKSEVAELIATYGSSSATAWLEFERYKLWRPSKPVPQSSFVPVQGYLRHDPYIFAWGNPLVSDPAALEPTAEQFVEWCRSQKLRPIWLCVDGDMERILGKNTKFNWSTLSCIVEDVLDPKHVIEVVHSEGGGSTIKDLKKNLRRAERANVKVREIKHDEWTEERKKEIEVGIQQWKKSRTGIQIASTSFQPWLDFEHRRYWVAEHEGKFVGVLVLSPIHPYSYQIKNAVSFPSAPRGTSEELIYRVMEDLESMEHSEEAQNQQDQSGLLMWQQPEKDTHVANGNASGNNEPSTASLTSSTAPSSAVPSSAQSIDSSRPTSPSGSDSIHSRQAHSRITVTFGVSAADKIVPVDNLSGWKITWLSKTYNKIVGATGLTKRGDFRNKFGSEHMPSYVCYPSEDGFGVDGATALLKCLRQN